MKQSNKTLLKFLLLLLFSASITLFAEEVYNPEINKGAKYENPYIRITVNSINKIDGGKKINMSLTITNKTKKDLFLRYNEEPTMMGNDGSMSWRSFVKGLSIGKSYDNNDIKEYTRIFAGNVTTVNTRFDFRNSNRSKGDVFTYSSRMAIYNEKDKNSAITFGAGISNIKLK